MTTAMIEPRDRAIIENAQRVVPVRVYALAKEFGCNVFADSLPRGISGKLQRDKESPSGWTIYTAGNEAEVRQRFTAAHELGHFLLHRGLLKDGISDDAFYRSHLSNAQEAEANRFAAELLMPWDRINDFVQKGITDVATLAQRFRVSEVAMSIRLGYPT